MVLVNCHSDKWYFVPSEKLANAICGKLFVLTGASGFSMLTESGTRRLGLDAERNTLSSHSTRADFLEYPRAGDYSYVLNYNCSLHCHHEHRDAEADELWTVRVWEVLHKAFQTGINLPPP